MKLMELFVPHTHTHTITIVHTKLRCGVGLNELSTELKAAPLCTQLKAASLCTQLKAASLCTQLKAAPLHTHSVRASPFIQLTFAPLHSVFQPYDNLTFCPPSNAVSSCNICVYRSSIYFPHLHFEAADFHNNE